MSEGREGLTTCAGCISFALHRDLVVIPKSVTPSRIAENIKSLNVKLDAEDMRKLREVGVASGCGL